MSNVIHRFIFGESDTDKDFKWGADGIIATLKYNSDKRVALLIVIPHFANKIGEFVESYFLPKGPIWVTTSDDDNYTKFKFLQVSSWEVLYLHTLTLKKTIDEIIGVRGKRTR